MRGAVRASLIIVFAMALATGADNASASERPPSASPASASIAVSARVDETAGVTRLVVDLSSPVSVSTAFTAAPDRLVVDLPDVNFQIDPAAGRLDGRSVGLIRGFRFGTVSRGHSKIVVVIGFVIDI